MLKAENLRRRASAWRLSVLDDKERRLGAREPYARACVESPPPSTLQDTSIVKQRKSGPLGFPNREAGPLRRVSTDFLEIREREMPAPADSNLILTTISALQAFELARYRLA